MTEGKALIKKTTRITTFLHLQAEWPQFASVLLNSIFHGNNKTVQSEELPPLLLHTTILGN